MTEPTPAPPSDENTAENEPTTEGPQEPQQQPNPAPFIPLVADNHTPRDYGSAKNYADAVRAWYMSSHHWLQCQHEHFLQNNPISSGPSIQLPAALNGNAQLRVNIHHRRILVNRNAVNDIRPEMFQQAAHQEQQPRAPLLQRLLGGRFPGGVNYQTNTLLVQRFTIPAFSRRLVAEIIDFFILFLIKMVIVYSLVEIEAIDLDQLESILNNSADLQTLIDITQGLFHLEVISKILSGILEAFCLTYGFASYPPGTTPGKFLMGLQVVSCVDVQPVAGAPNQVTVTSHPKIGLKSALIRSLLKNSVTNFLFPINVFFYSFNFNRAIYDLAAKTIVVSRDY